MMPEVYSEATTWQTQYLAVAVERIRLSIYVLALHTVCQGKKPATNISYKGF